MAVADREVSFLGDAAYPDRRAADQIRFVWSTVDARSHREQCIEASSPTDRAFHSTCSRRRRGPGRVKRRGAQRPDHLVW